MDLVLRNEEEESLSIASISQVTPEVFVGSIAAAKSKDYLKQLRITHVLSCIGGEALFLDDFKYLMMNFDDRESTNVRPLIERSMGFLEEGSKNGNRVFVYCGAGISRSVMIVIAFLMSRRGYTFEMARSHVQSCRPIANLNEGFVQQLMEIDYELRHG